MDIPNSYGYMGGYDLPDKDEKRQIRRYYTRVALIMGIFILVVNIMSRLVVNICCGILGGGFEKAAIDAGREIFNASPLLPVIYSFFFPLAADIVAFLEGLAITGADIGKKLRCTDFGGKDMLTATAMFFGAGTLGSFILTVVLMIWTMVGTPSQSTEMAGSIMASCPVWLKILTYLYICLIGPVMEELIYRGVLLEGLRKYGNKFGVIATSLMFALMHENIAQAIPAFFVGLVLGTAAVKTGSLLPSIFLHILNNSLSSVSTLFLERMDTEKIRQIAMGALETGDYDSLDGILEQMRPAALMMGVQFVIRGGFTAAAVVIAYKFIKSRRKVFEPETPGIRARTWKCFFSSFLWILIIIAFVIGTIV